MRNGLGVGILLGFVLSCIVWAAILVPIIIFDGP